MESLPSPDSEELRQLVKNRVSRAIYAVLYEHRDTYLTIHEIRELLGPDIGVQQHLDRRLRDLDPHFEISRARRHGTLGYALRRRLPVKRVPEAGISKSLRAWVLRHQRCAQCGRTPTDDGVRLHVDHKIPLRWGGTNDPENLQALCSECNEGKRHYYATYDEYSDQIKRAINFDEPHRRIGELLKAFDGAPVPGALLERVACARQYQEDWQKRLRELRTIGWKISVHRKKEGGRVRTYYALEHAEPWPEGRIRAAIREAELARKAEKRHGSEGTKSGR